MTRFLDELHGSVGEPCVVIRLIDSIPGTIEQIDGEMVTVAYDEPIDGKTKGAYHFSHVELTMSEEEAEEFHRGH